MPNEGEKNLIGTCGWRAHDFSPRQVQLMHPGWNLMKLVMPNVKLKKPNIISKFMGLLALKISVKTNYIFGIMFCSYVFWINDWVMFMTKNWLGLWSFCSVVSSSHQLSKGNKQNWHDQYSVVRRGYGSWPTTTCVYQYSSTN